jgi:hypothetical protein
MRDYAMRFGRRVIEANASTTSQLLRAHGRDVNEEKPTFNRRRLDRNDRRRLVACIRRREIDCVVHIYLED